jgi:mono/diheme cytochrome c family protein
MPINVIWHKSRRPVSTNRGRTTGGRHGNSGRTSKGSKNVRKPEIQAGSPGLLFAVALLAKPTFAADADNGRRLAFRWCQPCHVVASTQTRPTGEAPPFDEIAGRSNFDTARLALFLLDPHPKMPDMSLTRNEAADLAAYIGSLAK